MKVNQYWLILCSSLKLDLRAKSYNLIRIASTLDQALASIRIASRLDQALASIRIASRLDQALASIRIASALDQALASKSERKPLR
ncbi:hypothetical protein BaRGS_00008733 [Batillaria attramentaria]|uniref:Uncharacterized protein n=1 Tax=Batillaria attramentaria TaxID=370345 RepID=A0ABD0LKW5_9CAEN